MKSKKHLQSCAIAVALLLPCAAFGAQPVSITNASFENPVLTDGQLSAGIPNWTAINSGNIAVLNPTALDLSAQAPAGANVALITSAVTETGMSQVLTSTFASGASYSLTAKVANLLTAGFPGYRVQLVAGGMILAEDNNSLSIAEDSVATSTVTYNFNAGLHAALVGQPLEIRLLSKGLAINEEVAFDDVQLTVTLANPVANTGGPYTVPFGGSLSLNGGGSLPSDGQVITTYEWDLDNDGDFDEAITGATPASINDAVLKTTYGMVIGANTIRLRVTDNSAPTPKSATGTTTVTLAAPIACQLGVLNLSANGGINPNTGNPWQAGDKYRIAFHTLGTTPTTSNNPEFYNDFATAEAWTVPALQGSYWLAMVTVNLDGTTTQALSPKRHVRDNTGTGNLTGGFAQGGAGDPVYATNGTTCIARNNADIWNAWSNPFENSPGVPNATGTGNNAVRWASGTGPTPASQVVHYSPFLDQNGNQLVNPDNVHGKDIATGCNVDGSHVNALGNTTDVTTINRGNTNANTTGRIWNRFTDATTAGRAVYAISYPLTIVNLADNVNPNLLSFVDDKAGANVVLGVDSVVYTVTFSEGMNAGTIQPADFEFIGTATATIDSIRPTFESASILKITVTPTSAGTLQLRAKAGAVFEDFVGNEVDTTTAIADDTILTVVNDVTPPTLVSIEDNLSGGPVVAFNKVTYTVTFDEGMDAATVNPADFGNGGTAPITINSVSPTGNPAVYIVVVTPTAAGSLILQVLAGATMTDLVGNPLATGSALPDDTTITVEPDPIPALVSMTDNQGGLPVFAGQSFTYQVAFDQVINPATLTVEDFENASGPPVTVNAVVATSDPNTFAVHVTPGGAGALTLQIKAGSVITNVNGTAVNTTAALPDNTTITVNAGSGPARGTITVDGVAFWSGNLGTLIGNLNAGASNKLVVVVTGENGNPGSLDGNSSAVTYDGVPLTKIIDRNPIGGTPVDQTFNDIWFLDMAGVTTTSGTIVASVNTRGNVTAFALSGTAPGSGQTAISPRSSKSVVLSTGFANSIVIASHGMGGDGNTANVAAVSAVAPLIKASGQSSTANLWDGHVTATALVEAAGTNTYAFAGGNLVGSHTIAAEFLAAEVGGGTPFVNWAQGPFVATLTDSNPSLDFDGGGLETGIEWVVGGDPTNASDDAGKAPTFNNSDPSNFVFTYRRRDAAQADPKTAIAVQYSTDLVGWTAASNGVGGVTIDDSAIPEPGFRTVVVSIPKALAGGGGRLFARLNVVVTP